MNNHLKVLLKRDRLDKYFEQVNRTLEFSNNEVLPKDKQVLVQLINNIARRSPERTTNEIDRLSKEEFAKYIQQEKFKPFEESIPKPKQEQSNATKQMIDQDMKRREISIKKVNAPVRQSERQPERQQARQPERQQVDRSPVEADDDVFAANNKVSVSAFDDSYDPFEDMSKRKREDIYIEPIAPPPPIDVKKNNSVGNDDIAAERNGGDRDRPEPTRSAPARLAHDSERFAHERDSGRPEPARMAHDRDRPEPARMARDSGRPENDRERSEKIALDLSAEIHKLDMSRMQLKHDIEIAQKNIDIREDEFINKIGLLNELKSQIEKKIIDMKYQQPILLGDFDIRTITISGGNGISCIGNIDIIELFHHIGESRKVNVSLIGKTITVLELNLAANINLINSVNMSDVTEINLDTSNDDVYYFRLYTKKKTAKRSTKNNAI